MTLLPDITEESESDFFRLMALEDALGVVIRAAAHIDYQLLNLISECLPYPAIIDRMGLTYDNKINLALAVGLEERFAPPLRAIGTIRNKFAHRIDASLGNNEANAVFKAIASEDQSKVHSIYAKLRAQTPIPKWQKPFRSLDPLDRFRLIAITLRGILIVARRAIADEKRLVER